MIAAAVAAFALALKAIDPFDLDCAVSLDVLQQLVALVIDVGVDMVGDLAGGMADSRATWYYCEPSKAYFPYVEVCDEDWRPVHRRFAPR